MITYDKVWESYLNNYQVSEIQVPTNEVVIYSIIGNAVDRYNNRLSTNLECDNNVEIIYGVDCNSTNILLIANFIKLSSLLKEKTFTNSLWNGVQGSNDVGMKNYRPQMTGFEKSILECEREIERIIFNSLEDMW